MGFPYPSSALCVGLSADLAQSEIRYAGLSLVLTLLQIFSLFQQGKGKSAKEILGRIDYGGSFTLLTSVRIG
jgi:hypothetical protein